MKCYFLLISSAAALLAASGPTGGGGGTGVSGVTATNAIEVRSPNERVPAGTTFQAKFLLTQPRPIGSGGSSVFIDSFGIAGVSIFSPLGDAAGAAVWQNGFLNVNVVSPSGDYGSNLDYPFMTVTMEVPATKPTGSTFPLQLANASFTGPTGPFILTDPKPGVLTVGGTISIHNITPGGGTWPAGTIVKVEGTGFSPATKVVAKMRMSPITYVSPTELEFTLLDTLTTMDMMGLTAQNPDGSQVTYFSYLRGKLLTTPSRFLLRHTDPVFQSLTHTLGTFTMPALGAGQFAAIAIQNPTPATATVTFQVQSTGAVMTFTMPFGARLMDDVGSLLATTLNPGDVVTIRATSGVQMLGLLADEGQGTVQPFLPAF